jgi:hypothetical protein
LEVGDTARKSSLENGKKTKTTVLIKDYQETEDGKDGSSAGEGSAQKPSLDASVFKD